MYVGPCHTSLDTFILHWRGSLLAFPVDILGFNFSVTLVSSPRPFGRRALINWRLYSISVLRPKGLGDEARVTSRATFILQLG